MTIHTVAQLSIEILCVYIRPLVSQNSDHVVVLSVCIHKLTPEHLVIIIKKAKERGHYPKYN